MRRYYFDLRDGDDLAPDDEGLELPNIERVETYLGQFDGSEGRV
ncbi:DUF6894 family protein [Bradyrhizobium hereditatis]